MTQGRNEVAQSEGKDREETKRKILNGEGGAFSSVRFTYEVKRPYTL
jgi:hypothetical protein